MTQAFITATPLLQTKLHKRPFIQSSKRPFRAAVEVPRSPKTILSDLLKNNASFSVGSPVSPNISPTRRTDLAVNGQAPALAILTCSDSRCSPEIIFGSGLGDVFVVRNAGNVAWGDSVVGSLEFAVGVLKTPLVMVLGHTKCGAIAAAISKDKIDGPLGSHVLRLRELVGHMDAYEAMEANVKMGVKRLREGNTGVGQAFKEGSINVVGAVYDIDTGVVKIVEV